MLETHKVPSINGKEYNVIIDTIEDSNDCFIKSITFDGKEVDDYIDQNIIKERLAKILLEKIK